MPRGRKKVVKEDDGITNAPDNSITDAVEEPKEVIKAVEEDITVTEDVQKTDTVVTEDTAKRDEENSKKYFNLDELRSKRSRNPPAKPKMRIRDIDIISDEQKAILVRDEVSKILKNQGKTDEHSVVLFISGGKKQYYFVDIGTTYITSAWQFYRDNAVNPTPEKYLNLVQSVMGVNIAHIMSRVGLVELV